MKFCPIISNLEDLQRDVLRALQKRKIITTKIETSVTPQEEMGSVINENSHVQKFNKKL